ncbi:uncharacterized protein LOC135843805 [Planococcus citri]|uniref:uncharacterized protein LOC135843805 n=1 Tax=Planococcus citri TaxID=170843 RepID=UPI0031F7B85C
MDEVKVIQQKDLEKCSDCSIDMPHMCQNEATFYKQKPFSSNTRCPSQSSSISSNSGDICRICHCEGAPDLPLITPCYCSGSLRYVHQTCLQQWIKSSNIRNCELCKFQFIMQTKVKPFNEWEYLEMTGLERKKLLCAMLFHIIAMTCVCWSLYVLIDRTLDEVQKGHLEWPFWTKLIVVGIGFMGGIVFMYIQCKAYFILCQRWKAYNRVIYVQNAPEKNTSIPDRDTNEASCSFKRTDSSKRSSENMPETSCIDIKGVRNLHIFFSEENQIRLHRNDRLSENRAALMQNEQYANCKEVMNNGTKMDKGGHKCGNTSLHIQIGNMDCNRAVDRPSCNANSNQSDAKIYGGALCPSDLNVNRLPECDNKEKFRNEFKSDQSVVKLQIKKAEIVIEFGENSNAVKCASKTEPTARPAHKEIQPSFDARYDSNCAGLAISPRRKFSSEEYLDCDKVANESNESPTSRLLINEDKVPLNVFKEKSVLKDWKSSEDLVGVGKSADLKF